MSVEDKLINLCKYTDEEEKMYRNKQKLLFAGVVSAMLLAFVGIFLFKQQSFASWVKEDNGTKYEKENGMYAIGFTEIENERYYFNGDGYLLTGKFYVEDEKAYYYANKKGEIQTGVIKTKNLFYIADGNGKIQTGFVDYDNKRYYFNNKAELATGWFKGEERWYYADDSGIVQTGFITIDGYRYYLNSDGSRVSDAVMEIDGVTYIFNTDGSVDENGTSMYPVYQYLSGKRAGYGDLNNMEMNAKVQACAILRASGLKNGYSENPEGNIPIETLLKNRGVKCSGGYEFSYGGTEGYGIEQLMKDMERDINLSNVLKKESVKEVGLGFHEENNVCYYDIIFICYE